MTPPDFHETGAHRLAFDLVAQPHGASKEGRYRPAHVVLRVQDQKGILDFADFLVSTVDLDGMRETPKEGHHPRGAPGERLDVVQHEVQASRPARQQEALEGGDTRRVVEPQRAPIRSKTRSSRPGCSSSRSTAA